MLPGWRRRRSPQRASLRATFFGNVVDSGPARSSKQEFEAAIPSFVATRLTPALSRY